MSALPLCPLIRWSSHLWPLSLSLMRVYHVGHTIFVSIR
jgi:hypothetical protein